MKKVIIAILLICFIASMTNTVNAGTGEMTELVKIRCTCYYWTGNQCAYGGYPKEGLTVAGKPEWRNMTCAIYACDAESNVGEFIGYFEITDTGGEYIRSGERIDMYRDTLKDCNYWVAQYGDYVYFKIIESEG